MNAATDKMSKIARICADNVRLYGEEDKPSDADWWCRLADAWLTEDWQRYERSTWGRGN